MADDRIIAIPLLDRTRVANAIRRGVRLEINPVYAKAAIHGMPVELTEEQALDVADIALEALAKTHPDGKTWLINANRDLRFRNEAADAYWAAQYARQCRRSDGWRALALNAYVMLLGFASYWQLHWPTWARVAVVLGALGGTVALRYRLLRRDQRKAAER